MQASEPDASTTLLGCDDLTAQLKLLNKSPTVAVAWLHTTRMQTLVGRKGVAVHATEQQLPICFNKSNAVTRQTLSSGYPFEDTYGYSRAVRVGDHVFVSGTTARLPELEGDAYVQAQAVLGIVSDALIQAGAELRHVVRTVAYVVDMSDAPLVARAHAESFGTSRPASTLVQVAGLTPPTARVEFEVTAIIAD